MCRIHLIEEGVEGDELVCALEGWWGAGFEKLAMNLLEGFEVRDRLERV